MVLVVEMKWISVGVIKFWGAWLKFIMTFFKDQLRATSVQTCEVSQTSLYVYSGDNSYIFATYLSCCFFTFILQYFLIVG